jgi:hypothetical protein
VQLQQARSLNWGRVRGSAIAIGAFTVIGTVILSAMLSDTSFYMVKSRASIDRAIWALLFIPPSLTIGLLLGRWFDHRFWLVSALFVIVVIARSEQKEMIAPDFISLYIAGAMGSLIYQFAHPFYQTRAPRVGKVENVGGRGGDHPPS